MRPGKFLGSFLSWSAWHALLIPYTLWEIRLKLLAHVQAVLEPQSDTINLTNMAEQNLLQLHQLQLDLQCFVNDVLELKDHFSFESACKLHLQVLPNFELVPELPSDILILSI